MLEHFNYQPEKKSKLRKQSLKKAIVKTSFDNILHRLKQKKEEEETGYKTDRIQSDINWMKEECRKGRFHSETISTPTSEAYGSKYHKKTALTDNL